MSDFQLILLFSILFGTVLLVEMSRTYLILFFAAIANLVMYPFTIEYSVVLEAGLDGLILWLLIFWGDKHKVYQIGVLFCALLLHMQFELDQANGTDLIFSHYGAIIIGITVMQLLGASHGVLNRFSELLWPRNHYKRLYSSGHNLDRSKVWPKD
jgi:hypothetical protein